MDKSSIPHFVVGYSGDNYPCDFFIKEELKLEDIDYDSFDTC